MYVKVGKGIMQMIKRSLIVIIILLLIIYKVPIDETESITTAQIVEEVIINLEEPIVDELLKETQIEASEELTINSETGEIKNEPEKITTYSQECVDFIKSKEKFKENAYKPIPTEKYWTIGYGHYGADVKEGQTITESEAYELLIQEIEKASEYVAKKCDYLNLTQSQFDALVSFTFNGGNGMLNQLIKNGTRNMEEIKEHITAYNNKGLKGLIIRRNEELQMLNK